MNKTLTKSEAKQIFNIDFDYGEHEFIYNSYGGIYNFKLGSFKHDRLNTFKSVFFIVEDEYLMHGNGD